jgi:serine/threonine-protein kinase
VERFLREIRVHTRLSHPNIVSFHDALEVDGQLVMTAEFVEGTTLAKRCHEGPLPASEAVREICEVLSGLEEAHALGIVHRGITADCVMLTEDGEVKLGGFGLAKPASDVNLTQVGVVVGDPRYISPEQVMGITALDSRSDLYSVGILLYQALTGTVPFRSPNDFDVMVAHIGSAPVPPSSRNPGISPELDQIVLKALAKKPDERFSNAREFRMALASVGGIAPQSPPQPAMPKPEYVPPILLTSETGASSRAGFVFGLVCVAVAILLSYVAMH